MGGDALPLSPWTERRDSETILVWGLCGRVDGGTVGVLWYNTMKMGIEACVHLPNLGSARCHRYIDAAGQGTCQQAKTFRYL
jgi:hypothetical protein